MTAAYDAREDMRIRMRPDPEAVAVAIAAASATRNPARLLAAIPMAFPGKQRDWWTAGQEVITLHGLVLLGYNGTPPAGYPYPDYSQARDQASKAARAALNGQPGTVGWATVYPDGDWHVTEDVL
jgi:hypothetical protein